MQIELARLLHGRKFDVAINLAIHGEVNNLLHLSGAPVTVGFASGNTDWMTLSLSAATHDAKSGADLMRHSARTRTLVEAFGALLDSGAAPLRRTDLDRNVLNARGIGNNDEFAVLHTGARIQFTRWHGYLELAEKLLTETDLKIVIMSDKPDEAISAFAEKHSDRVVAVAGKIPFDHFDAFLSYCKVFVGNDSGPKHFAALRGTQVVSIHSARIGWEEWGQEISGVVLSRKVPCAGCYLHYEPTECAKDVACIKYIQVDEVLREVKNCLIVT
nr:glycosyltransferase family 9 protein [Sphingopyxis panaciterrae]